MPTTVMTIKLVNPPAVGSERGSIVGTDDFRLGVFSEKIGLFQVGKAYEIEYTDGKYKNVKSAKPVALPAASQPREPFVSGLPGNSHHRAPPSNPAKDEQIFVQGVLQALIRGGYIKSTTEKELDLKQELWKTTQMLRGLYKHTFGFEAGRVPYDQAAE